MIKYIKPEIDIVKFSIENIVTDSSVLTGMVDGSTTKVEVISYNDILATE